MVPSINATRIRLRSDSPEDTERVGEVIASIEPAPILIAIEGELGAGKTRLVRGLARGLGIDVEDVSSPTFILCCRHDGQNVSLAHLDAYRMTGTQELDTIGFDEMLEEEHLVMAVEWATRIDDAIPSERIEIRLAHRADTERAIEIIDTRPCEKARARLLDALTIRCNARESSLAESNHCPSCGGSIEENEARPFCSRRCRLADLGNWLGGRYSISRPMHNDEELSD